MQLAPNHVAPDWPTGPQQQQVHLDLHVDDLETADRLALELGGRQLQAARKPADNPDGDETFAVYASPAGIHSASASTDVLDLATRGSRTAGGIGSTEIGGPAVLPQLDIMLLIGV